MTAVGTIPTELRELPQWVLWRHEQRDGKRTKVPYQAAAPARQASTTDPSTWATFEQALAARGRADGVGLVFSPDDPYAGIDLDDCLDEHGEIEPWAADIVEKLDSYTERTPSGRGLHVIARAKVKGSRRRKGSVEVYDSGRYFTVLGKLVGARDTVRERQAQLDDLLGRLLPPESAPPRASGGGLPAGDDRHLLERAFAARNGDRVAALWRGELNGYGSQSEADLALCSALAFWTGPDPARLDRLFRASGLMRDKWDSGRGEATYGAQTIEKALGRSEFYEAPQGRPWAPERAVAEPTAGGGDDAAARDELAELLALPSVGLAIVGARIVGRGSRASADLYLSDGTEVNFESLREVAHATRLGVEVTACTGATPALKAPMAQKALALLRRISERRESFTRDQIAFDWGASYLQSARAVDVDMRSREDRWRAFSELERHDPRAVARDQAMPLERAGLVLEHTDGSRFVRTGWFFDSVRTQDVSARRERRDCGPDGAGRLASAGRDRADQGHASGLSRSARLSLLRGPARLGGRPVIAALVTPLRLVYS